MIDVMTFAETLRRQREKIGYASARAFFRRFGQGFFGCTYKAYLNVEAGRSTPQPRLAMRIALALRVQDDAARSKEFVAAYLQSLLGRNELASFLVRTLSAAPATPGRGSLFERAARKNFSAASVPLTERQADALCGSKEHYWAFTMLTNDHGRWSPAEMARRIGSTEPALRRALEDLRALKIARRAPGNRWFSPLAGRVFIFPRDKFFTPLYLPKLKAHWHEAAARGGSVLYTRHLVTRASEARLRGYFPHLARSVYGAHIYALTEKGEDTGFFTVSTTVRRLMPL